MGELGLAGVVRGKVKRTTISDPNTAEPRDLVNRNFHPLAPNRLWVADIAYVSTWSGWCCTAFVIDAFARRMLGSSVATTMTSQHRPTICRFRTMLIGHRTPMLRHLRDARPLEFG